MIRITDSLLCTKQGFEGIQRMIGGIEQQQQVKYILRKPMDYTEMSIHYTCRCKLDVFIAGERHCVVDELLQGMDYVTIQKEKESVEKYIDDEYNRIIAEYHNA